MHVQTGNEASKTPQAAGQEKVSQDAGPPQPKEQRRRKHQRQLHRPSSLNTWEICRSSKNKQ